MQCAEKLAAWREEELQLLRAQLNAENANAGRPTRRNRHGARNCAATLDPPPDNRPDEPNSANHDGRPAEPANRPGAAVGAGAQDVLDPAVVARLLKSENNRALIQLAGHRCCLLHYPFMEPDFLTDDAVQQAFLQILWDLENKLAAAAENEDENEDPEDNFWAERQFKLAEPTEIV
ncbi:hypothetical protein FRC08_017042 [Ceratobasidium sp. 394]|nr:hypothetical protein FRC08_017042 [Ceratobasidium sp. 394]